MKKVLVLVLALALSMTLLAGMASAEAVAGDINGDGVFKVGFSELDIDRRVARDAGGEHGRRGDLARL